MIKGPHFPGPWLVTTTAIPSADSNALDSPFRSWSPWLASTAARAGQALGVVDWLVTSQYFNIRGYSNYGG